MRNAAKTLTLCVLIALVGACSEGGSIPTSPTPAAAATTASTTANVVGPDAPSAPGTAPAPNLPAPNLPAPAPTAPDPKTTFGAGTYAVNTDIAAGRYFARPGFMCNLKRLSGLGGTPADVIMWEFLGDKVDQWIVDIARTDADFQTDAACGTWTKDGPVRGLESNITAGIWLVGSQVSPGRYTSSVWSGCYWERLRGFGSKGTEEIIANNFIEADSPQIVDIKAGDVGFRTSSECGTWIPATAGPALPSGNAAPSPSMIQQNKDRDRARHSH